MICTVLKHKYEVLFSILEIFGFIEGKLQEETGGCIYISGNHIIHNKESPFVLFLLFVSLSLYFLGDREQENGQPNFCTKRDTMFLFF